MSLNVSREGVNFDPTNFPEYEVLKEQVKNLTSHNFKMNERNDPLIDPNSNPDTNQLEEINSNRVEQFKDSLNFNYDLKN